MDRGIFSEWGGVFFFVGGWVVGLEGLYFLLGLGSRIDFGIHAKL